MARSVTYNRYPVRPKSNPNPMPSSAPGELPNTCLSDESRIMRIPASAMRRVEYFCAKSHRSCDRIEPGVRYTYKAFIFFGGKIVATADMIKKIHPQIKGIV